MKAISICISTLLILMTIHAAQAQDAASKAKILKVKIMESPTSEVSLLRTSVIEPKYSKGKLRLKGKYGGGCKEHSFEIQSNGKLDDQGILHLYLVDHTTDDFCKAFKFADLSVDVKALFKKLPKTFKVQINQSEILAVSR